MGQDFLDIQYEGGGEGGGVKRKGRVITINVVLNSLMVGRLFIGFGGGELKAFCL